MAAINRYTQRTPAQPDFYKTPLEPMLAALQMKQQKYDQYAALADEIGATSIDALDADRARLLIQLYVDTMIVLIV
jgi:hypothetical protein